MRRLVIVSGLSGAGKSVALNALEDFGFYCVDNLPIGILLGFIDFLASQNNPHYDNVAVGIDVRNTGKTIAELPLLLDRLDQDLIRTEIVFMSATIEALLQRFSETRRKHPLSTGNVTLRDAIVLEHQILDPVSASADLRIDTSLFTVHELRKLVREVIVAKPADQISLQFVSFGYKKGIPTDVDFVFDVRCLPNPFWDLDLRDKNGCESEVIDFLDKQQLVAKMIEDINHFLSEWLRSFEKVSRIYLTIAFGCTGGRHRSVYMAEKICTSFLTENKKAKVSHRDL